MADALKNTRAGRGGSWLGALRPYADHRPCGWPLAAGLLVMLFLVPQQWSASWLPRPAAHETTAIDALLDAPAAAASRYRQAIWAPGNYTEHELKRAASISGVGVWRFMTGLLVLVLAFGLGIAAYVIYHAPRAWSPAARRDLTLLAFAFCFAFFLLLQHLGLVWNSTVTVRAFLGHIGEQLGGADLVKSELLLNFTGYLMALYLLCAAAATLIPYRARDGEDASPRARLESRARHCAEQMGRLRLLLYVGAVALAVVTLRARLNFNWALAYLPPLAVFAEKSAELLAAKLLYERLDTIVANTVASIGVLNTLVLAAIYVPAALVLRRRAQDLAAERAQAAPAAAPAPGWGALVGDLDAGGATKPAPPPDREEWLRARGLAFPVKEHLGRIAVILSPLLTGPISELLVLLKN